MLQEVKDKIDKSLSPRDFLSKGFIPILDKGTPYTGKGYTAVSYNYIKQYLLEDEYELPIVCRALFDLIKEGKVIALPCSHAADIVFRTTQFNGWGNFEFSDEELTAHWHYDVDKYATYYPDKVKVFNELKNSYVDG